MIVGITIITEYPFGIESLKHDIRILRVEVFWLREVAAELPLTMKGIHGRRVLGVCFHTERF